MMPSLKLLLLQVLCLSNIKGGVSSGWWGWFGLGGPADLGVKVITQSMYDDLKIKITQLIATLETEAEQVNLAGDIVRLAINDMLDFRATASPELRGGSDGCLSDNEENNKLLDDLWSSPGGTDKEFLGIRNTHFRHMSDADFWVASAAVVLNNRKYPHSVTDFEFRWGREDASSENCESMKAENRAPDFSSALGCDELEDKLIDSMDMTWLDVVALLGYHTLGANVDGRAWTDHTSKSFDFDNSYYKALVNDGWVPRDEAAKSWGWGGQISHPVIMYPVDLCLLYDLKTSPTQCCTNEKNDCRDPKGTVLPACNLLPSDSPRRIAVESFANDGGDNINSEYFLSYFATVFRDLSLNGHGLLYSSNWQNSTEVECKDLCFFANTRNKQRSCGWVEKRADPRCDAYGHYCPTTCGLIGPEFYPEKCRFAKESPSSTKECTKVSR